MVFVLVGILLVTVSGAVGYFWRNSELARQAEQSIGTASKTSPQNPPEKSLEIKSPTKTINWKTYMVETEPTLKLADYQISLPSGWWRIEHSSAFQSVETFRDEQNVQGVYTYQLIIQEEKNINAKTNQPFPGLQSLTGFPYELPTRVVGGEQAVQVLPHAGSEMNYKVLFFSRDNKLFVSVELDTPRDGSKTNEGKLLFDQILSTFRFLR